MRFMNIFGSPHDIYFVYSFVIPFILLILQINILQYYYIDII